MKRNVLGRTWAGGLLAASLAAGAADPPSTGIYGCIDARGKKHFSQARIAECADTDMTVLNPDGSVRAVIRRPSTEKEREVEEARARESEAACRDRKVEGLAHRTLVKRFPNRRRHDTARQKAIEDIAKAMRVSAKRIEELVRDKKRLDDEREFYPPPLQLPARLKLAIDKNDSALEAQNKLVSQQKDELQRISKRFDEELALLQKLWRAPPALPGC